jgi:ubiquinone/menaquinone biosynthesis C-methylase UbiE
MTLAEAKTLINCDRLNTSQPQTWFDLGCGSGLFSQALDELLPEDCLIYAIDKTFTSFSSNQIRFLQLDFVKGPLPAVSVDGILMANSLHFVKDKLQFLNRIKKFLSAKGIFILVEYDIETSNQWVPYPISFRLTKSLFTQVGFESADKLSEIPSRFNNRRIYSALFYNLAK